MHVHMTLASVLTRQHLSSPPCLCFFFHTFPPQDFRSTWYNAFNVDGDRSNTTLQNYFKSCSYGKTLMVGAAEGTLRRWVLQ